MTKLVRQLLACCCICLSLTSCGFHLRGLADLPPAINHIALIIQHGHPDLEPLLREQFKSYHRAMVEPSDKPHYYLIIENDDLQQNIASISSSTTPRQYRLVYTLKFKFISTNGTTLLPSKNIIITRPLTVNSDRILGSNNEESHITYEMHRDAVIALIYQLGHIQS